MAGTYPLLTSVLPSYYNEEAPEYPGLKHIYQDLGADFLTLADTAVRRFTILYTSDGGLLAAEAAQFVTLANDNKYNPREGSLLGFGFTPRGESALTNVRFDEGGFVIRRGRKSKIYMVECRLIKRP
jgi:hypothetical protein